MRLIDADRLRELYEDCEGLKVSCELVLQNIDDQPTAYDVEAVVRELEEKSMMYSLNDRDCIFAIPLNDAIEIVKRGGRNDSNT